MALSSGNGYSVSAFMLASLNFLLPPSRLSVACTCGCRSAVVVAMFDFLLPLFSVFRPSSRGGKYSFSLLPVVLLLLMPVAGRTQEQPSVLEIENFVLRTAPDAVHVTSGFRLENSAPIKAQLRDGAQMILSCTIRLERLRTLLSNVTLSETTLVFHLRHDPLLREFILFSDAAETARSKNLNALLTAAWNPLHVVLPLREPPETGAPCRITVNVTLQHATVPPWLEQALFFWSWDVVPPLSLTQEFTY